MSWLKSVNDKLFMALTSKGKPQHVCDCVENLPWNNGWFPTESSEYITIMSASNLEGVPEDAPDTDNRVMQTTIDGSISDAFDTFKMEYISGSSEANGFYVKSICIKLKGSDECYVPAVKNVFGGEYSDESKTELLGNISGYVGGLFNDDDTGVGMWQFINHGAEYYVVLETPIQYSDIESIKWEYFLDDPSGEVKLHCNQNYRLFQTGDVAVHNGSLYEAKGKVNDADDEPGKSIHWEFICSFNKKKTKKFFCSNSNSESHSDSNSESYSDSNSDARVSMCGGHSVVPCYQISAGCEG